MKFHPSSSASGAVIALTVAVSLAGAPASASNISDLKEFYGGSWHCTTSTDNENLSKEFIVTSTNHDGTFSGIFGSVRINGKVNGKGKITFSGSGNENASSAPASGGVVNAQIKNGKAQLSATGRFIVGSFTYEGTGIQLSRYRKYVFSMESSPTLTSGAGVNASSRT